MRDTDDDEPIDYRRGPAPTPNPPPKTTDEHWAAEQRHEAAKLRAAAITACPLCDQDGYRRLTVCDHTDHTATNQRGIAAVRAALATRPPTTPQQHPPNTPTGHTDGKNTHL